MFEEAKSIFTKNYLIYVVWCV